MMWGIAFGLCFVVGAHASPGDRQTYIEYRIIPGNQKLPPKSEVRKVWRAGTRFARTEEPYKSRQPVHIAVIVNEPDIYMVELNMHMGQHFIDPDPAKKVTIPAFPFLTSPVLQTLEIGRELEFFKTHRASREDDVDLRGARCAVYTLNLDDNNLRLYIDLKARAPRQLHLSTANGAYIIQYVKYQRNQPFAPSLFSPPEDVNITEAVAPQKNIHTPFDAIPRPQPYFQVQEARSSETLDNQNCRDRPILFYFFDSADEIGPDVISYISSLYKKYGQTQLCFFPLPRHIDEGTQDAEKFDFPVYDLKGLDHRIVRIMRKDDLWRDGKPRAIMFDRKGVESYFNADTRDELSDLDPLVDQIVHDGAAESNIEESDSSVLAGIREDDQEDRARGRRIVALLNEKRFAELDRIFALSRSNKVRSRDGKWEINLLYQPLFGEEDKGSVKLDEKGILERMDLLNEWISARPTSITPRVALMRLWLHYSLFAGAPSSDGQDGKDNRREMSERLAKSRAVLDEGRALREKCPEFFSIALSVAASDDMPESDYAELLEEGKSIEPRFELMYFQEIVRLYRKWGESGAWEKFAADIIKEDPGGEGAAMYARLAVLVKDEFVFGYKGEDIFKSTKLSWPDVKRGFLDMQRQYPDSKANANNFAFLACAAGDKVTAREAFSAIGSNYSARIWGNRLVYDLSRRWAEGS